MSETDGIGVVQGTGGMGADPVTGTSQSAESAADRDPVTIATEGSAVDHEPIDPENENGHALLARARREKTGAAPVFGLIGVNVAAPPNGHAAGTRSAKSRPSEQSVPVIVITEASHAPDPPRQRNGMMLRFGRRARSRNASKRLRHIWPHNVRPAQKAYRFPAWRIGAVRATGLPKPSVSLDQVTTSIATDPETSGEIGTVNETRTAKGRETARGASGSARGMTTGIGRGTGHGTGTTGVRGGAAGLGAAAAVGTGVRTGTETGTGRGRGTVPVTETVRGTVRGIAREIATGEADVSVASTPDGTDGTEDEAEVPARDGCDYLVALLCWKPSTKALILRHSGSGPKTGKIRTGLCRLYHGPPNIWVPECISRPPFQASFLYGLHSSICVDE